MNATSRLLAVGAGLTMAIVIPNGSGVASAAGEPSVVVVSTTPTNGLAPATVSGPAASHSYQIAATVPLGGSLSPVQSPAKTAQGDTSFSSEVLVKDAAGKVVGAYDAPYAIDAKGSVLTATYRIEGTNLVQTVPFDRTTAFPLRVLLSDYAPVTLGQGDGFTAMVSQVTVPSNYVYNPSRGSLHDYCTSSPDSYLAADFRGPCARHDLCYEAPGNHKSACDNTFHGHLVNNCDYAFGSWNPVRYSCRVAAAEYWAAVTAFGDDT
ncbi:phospholipase A2 [Micromonospora sp. NPDC048839]|uniref:phospholipase A2 n=1 Tax=Micromonospora sp. NPDC048839 TaxID=3155641 RepID=UPI0033D5EAAE